MIDIVTTPEIGAGLDAVHAQLHRPGTWWDAAQLGAVARRARDGFGQRHQPPWMRELPAEVEGLPAAAVAVIDKISIDPGSVTREWARAQIAELGDAPYVELVGVCAVAVMVHMYAESSGESVEPLGPPIAGEPSRERPEGMADIGAHVPMLDPFPAPNVARALSLVPSANQAFYLLVMPMYSAAGFNELVWDTPLSRPQVELVAARVAAMNECFY